MANKGREYEIAFKLGAMLESSFRQTMGNAENSVDDLEQVIRRLSNHHAFDDLRHEADQADRTIRKLHDTSEDFGETLQRVAEYTSAFSIVQGVAESFQSIIGTFGDFGDSMAQLQASTGVSAAEMAELEGMAQKLYKLPIGDNFADLTDALETAKQVTQATGAELETMTKNAIIYRDVFKGDFTESIKTTDTMMRNFGITNEESFNLLAQGVQKGLDKSGELLDTANEYSVYFKNLGFDANQMFDLFAAGLEAGAFNLDKVGDILKEFEIRSKDMSDTSVQAYQLLGLNAEEMSKTFASGGPEAQKSFKQIVAAISSIQDPVERNTVAVNLFGTQFEDLEQNVLFAMGTARSQFDMTKATMEEVAKVKYDTISKDFQAVGRELMTELVIPIAEDLMPTLRGLADWMSDNKEIIEALALGVPAALIGKNVVKLVKGIGRVESAAAGAAGVAGRFGSGLALLTNPVGLAVTGVAALTLGVVAYKRNQEQTRQELIHMGDTLQEASKDYEEIADKAASTHDLVEEYRKLSQAVEESAGKSSDLAAKKERLAEVTSLLQELYPDIITHYDVENDKIREKLDLLSRESTAEQELAKLKLEKEVADKERDLPKLENEIKKLEDQSGAALEQRNALDSAIPALKEYTAEFDRLMEMDATEERTTALEDLRKKVNEVSETVGYYFANNMQLSTLEDTINDLTDDRVKAIDEQIKKLDELQTSQSSYQELYDAQKSLIELNLGGKLEDQAKKFNSLSDEEKSHFNEALTAVTELNNEMDLLPSEKKINIELLYKQTGQKPPSTGSDLLNKWNQKISPITMLPRIPQFADGGVATRPSIFGEAGPEIAIPLDGRPRSQSLLDLANHLMGRGGNPGEMSVTFAPHISVQGGGSDVGKQIAQAISKAQDDFERRFRVMMQQQGRVSMT